MKIENLRTEKNGNRPRVSAQSPGKTATGPACELYFETEEEFEDGLSCNPHAFLVGCRIARDASRGKKGLLDAEICPELRENLITAMHWVRHWYYNPGHDLVRIEAGTKTGMQSPRTPERTGMFSSPVGLMSYGTLCCKSLELSGGTSGIDQGRPASLRAECRIGQQA